MYEFKTHGRWTFCGMHCSILHLVAMARAVILSHVRTSVTMHGSMMVSEKSMIRTLVKYGTKLLHC